MGDSTFRAQDAVLAFGWPAAADAAISEWYDAPAFDRYSSVYENINMTGAIARADRSGTISGLIGQVTGPRTAINPTAEFEVPLALNSFCLGLIAQHAGAAKNEAQLGSDSAWRQVIDPDQTDVDLRNHYLSFLYDQKDGFPQIWHPVGINEIAWNFEKGDVAKLAFTGVSLGWRYYSLYSQDTGTPRIAIRGWLNPDNNALADKLLSMKCTDYTSPDATMIAEFGAGPGFLGTVSFVLNDTLDAEGQPRWVEVLDSESDDPGLPIGTADNKLEAAILNSGDVAALDEISYRNPVASPTKVIPPQPEMTVSSICLTVDGTKVADLEGLTVTTVNDLAVVEGGACGAFPRRFKRTGNSTCTVEFERGWLTYRHMSDLKDDASFAVLIEGRSDTQVDPGGARSDQYNFSLEIPLAKFSDGQEFKSLGGGAEDDTETISLMGEPDATNPQWRLTCDTDVEDILTS